MPARHEPIAVIGSACRFPGKTDTPSKLWELLKAPRDLLKTIPADRFNAEAWYHPDNAHHGTSNVTQSYFLEENVAEFDTQFFNIPPSETEAIDPQQRMLMETVFESLCAAGIPMEKLRGSSTACYVGQMCDDWSGILMRDWDSIPQYAATGISRSIMSNRVSYFFDWHGPSMTIDTACSSSLVAVHEAVNVLRSGDSNVAVACGANLILSPGMYVAESKLKMLSPDGRSRMWDADANGYARGEGIAAVVLKTLSQAIADGDHIDCIIRETGFNQDGRTSGITMPSNVAQASLIRDTYIKAGLDPKNPLDRPQFFHAHGTGTPAGDPQEAEAISRSFYNEGEKADDKLFVGSIKTVIGHTEGTAGLASLIGTSLALQNRTIPPNMHLNKLSDKVRPYYDNLEVPVAAKDWPVVPAGQPLRASVNSFGFGGANAHAILESYEPEVHRAAIAAPLFTPLTFSANTEKSLKRMLQASADFLKENDDLSIHDVAYTLQSRRSALPFKAAISGKTVDALISAIEEVTASKDSIGVKSTASKDLSILGVFTGQGAQWPMMGKQLLKSSPYAAKVIADLEKSLQDLPEADRPSWSIRAELEAGKKTSRLSEAALSQPLCTAVQVVLVDLLKAAGISFKAVVGHSSGEIAAAYAAGFISASDAIRIAYYRGVYAQLAGSSSGSKGSMMAVGTSLEDAEEFCALEQFAGRLTVAASNGAASVTLSGDEDAVDEAEEIFKDEGKFARKLRVDTAYHSFHMIPCSRPYLEALERAKVAFGEGSSSTTWFSSVTGNTKMTKETLGGQYWVDNMRNPVLFSQAVASAVQGAGPFDLAIEVGPHPALKGPAQDNIEAASGTPGTPYTGLLSRGADDVNAFSAGLGYIWERFGAGSVNFDGYEKLASGVSEEKTLVHSFPAYTWDHDTSYWTASRVSGSYKSRDEKPHPILGVKVEEGCTGQQVLWRNLLYPREISWMTGHKLQGQIVFPASGYAAMAVEAIMTLAGENSVSLIEIQDFQIARAITFLEESTGIEVAFTMGILSRTDEAVTADFQVSSCPRGERAMVLNASGTVTIELGDASVEALATAPVPKFNMVDVDIDRFYNTLTELGYNYSPPFHALTSISRRTDAAIGVMTDVRGSTWEDNLLIHPGILDTAFQTVFAAFSSPGDERLWGIYVPTGIKRISINPSLAVFPAGKEAQWPWQTSVTSGPEAIPVADIEVFADNGKDVMLEIEGIKLVPLSAASADNDEHLFSSFMYSLAKPDGDIAGPNKPTDFDVRLAKDSERFSFYWIHQLLAQITPQDEEQTLVHYQRMLRWCKYKHSQVINGEHSYVGPEAQYDTLEFVEALMKPYGERSDIGLIRAVGQNLPHVIKTRGNIVEHMVKDGMLDAFYEEGLGLQIANGWEANLAQQAVHRYPRMNIIEIGGGTGGSTRMILPKLGKAFSTYTFTDISAGFFDAAEERFSEYADRMIFRTFDMEKDITEQGYVEGHYDMVLASNVLHAGPDLDFIMSNVRKLVKPGGLLINMEAATYQPSLRNGFAMAGLPGWWCGAETGRPWGPTISVEAWDELFKKTGWSGVDTRPPHMDELHHFTVMVTQAVDDRINFLREPLVIEAPDTKKGHLVIVGGKTDDSADIVGQLEDILAPHYSKIDTIITLEEFADITAEDPPTVLNLSELDAAIMEEIMNDGPEKFDALKDLFVNASDIVWVTKNNRFENPFSRMVPGMARALIKENPHVKFKSLDVDTLNDNSATLFAEELLRHQKLVQWSKELAPGTIHWSEEPEVHYVDGRAYVPRLKPVDEMNFRYNSQKRIISNEVNPSETTIALAPKDGSYELRQPTPVKLQQKVENGVTIKVSKSLLQSVQIPTAGHFFLCYGTNESDEKVVALSNTSESVVEVPDIWTIPYKGKVDPAQCLLSIAANMYANVVIADAPANSTLLVHDPDPVVAAALFKQAAAKKMRVFCTTSNTEKKGPHWIYVHPQAPSRLLKKKLPKEISTFVYVTGKQEELLISNISKELPFGCEQRNLSAFFGTNHKVDSPSSRDFIAQYLSRGWSMARASNFAIPAPRDTVPLKDVTSYSRVKGQLAVVDWETTSEVPVNVHAVDACDAIFKSDRTYLMVGLSGDVGQTLTQWMVLHGARHVVLTSRNPKVNTEWIDNLEEDYGADVRAMKLDITDRDELHAVYNKITRTMPPIAGVAHGAMVLVDNLFQNMEYEELMTVLKPKVLGAIYLDELFSEDTLDFFILFSSITGVVGNTGQSNYMAGNFFLEALGLQRRNKGLVASVIGISSLVGVGYVERSENFDAGHFKRLGYRNVSEQDVQMLFAEAITQGKPGATGSHEIITGVVPRFANQDGVAAYLQDVKFGHLILERTAEKSDGSGAVQVPVRVQLQTATTEDEAREIMQIGFTSRVKKILRIPEEEDFSDTTSLVEQGVDSLVAVEIRGWFLKEVDVDIPVLKVLGGASIQDLLTEAIGHLAPAMIPQMGSTSAAPRKLNSDAEEAERRKVAAEKKKAEVERKRVEEEEQKKAEEEKKRMAEEERRRKEDDTLKVVFSTRRKSIQLNNIILKKQQEEKKIEEERKAFETMVNAEVTERQSFGQSRFWFLNQALKDKTTFNMCVLVRLEGKINKKQMENAVTTVGSRHESLRTRFFATGEYMENPMQGIAPSSTIKFEHKRIKGEAAAKEEMEKMTKHTWDLERYDTMKISMLSSSDTMHWLLIACHHIIMDGFSFNVFFADLEKAYKGRRLPVLPEASQYRAFAKLQHTNWEGGLLKDDIQYYRDMIPKDLKPVPLFPFARTSTRLPLASYGANKIEVRIPAALTSKIKAASRKAKATTFHFYLATLQVLMFRLLKDCDDFFIGIADANRVDDKFTPTLGFLLNLLPMRFERNSAATFSEAVTQARNKVYGGLAHSKLPFNILLEQLDIARSSAHTPLFQIFVDYRQGVQERQKYMGVNAHGQDWHIAKSGYDMTLDILENPDGEARLELGLQKQLYTTENAKVLLDGYVTLLTAFAATPDANWTEPEVWQKEMVSKALDAGRGGKIEYEFGPTMAHRVDEMIRQHGSETALKDGSGRAMTYAEMGRRIDSIASAIISAGATNGARVAVFQQPTADWVCSLLAIFRAGAVYIPLDLRTPLTRLAAIANEAKPHAILADDHTLADANELGARDAKIINASALPAGGDATNNQAQGDGPAVILFTSGSTGTPKGIHINHTNIIKQVEGFAKQCDVKATGGCVLQQSAYSFDKSLQQIFLALANGATLYVVPAEQRGDPIAQVQIMATEGVTHTAATPSEYMMWFRYAKESLVKCNAWKFALLGGEPATEPLLEEFRNLGLPLRVINSYGPAEITMSCAKADMPYMTMQHGDPIPVGYLLPNYSAYIVDEKMQPVPIGFSGEIVLSGVGVSSGYLNNEELTQQKFTPDIFGGSGNMYRTGDKGRLGEDGMLYCEGRLDGDTQIKLRGVRMELEDIENTILQSSNGALEGAVVTLRGDQDAAFLAAHVVFSPTYTEDKDNLLTRLPTLLPLPQYMVPSVFVSLDSLPLTAHLKVDRKAIKALELPEDDNAVVEEAAELTTTESQLGAIWRDMIPRIPALQPNSNFFYIGGNSLLLVKLQAIIRKTLHANLKLIDIMNAATLSSMARLIDDNKVDHIYWESEIALPEIPASKGAAPKKGKDLTVMVTGATGVLGRRLIPQLTSDSRIAKVYCVAVRPQDGSVRSRIAEQCSKVEVKEGDLTLPRLGLSEQDAATISSSVDVIFHLGANRSFWDSYYELRPHNVQSMRELIMLSAPRKIPIHYVSSGGVTAYESTSPPSDGSDGYVASKWAAERMLANASSELGLPCVAHRPTMASGGVSDAPVEVLDELMDLAKQLQKKPLLDGLSGSLGIIPGNVIAKNVADAIFSQAATGFEIIPQYSAFNADVKSLHDRVKADTELEALEGVPALKWMGMAKKKGWSQFMVGQELTMSNAGEQVISRR